MERSGPLPLPSELREYEAILPGAAERIFTMAENEQSHRIRRENKELDLELTAIETVRAGADNEFKLGIVGSLFGFTLGLVGTVGGLALCWIGLWQPGLSAFFFSLAVLAGSFAYGASIRRSERRRSTSHPSEP